MADVSEALDAALSARYPRQEVKSPAASRRGLTARMNQLEKLFTRKGDRPGAARTRAAAAAGIPARTWRDWLSGRHKPGAKNLGKLQDAYHNLITLPKLRRKVTPASVPSAVNVRADVRWNGYLNRQPYRQVKFRYHVQTVMVATIRAWAREGPEAAAAAFQHGLAVAENLPSTEDAPGILFEGNRVEIDFP